MNDIQLEERVRMLEIFKEGTSKDIFHLREITTNIYNMLVDYSKKIDSFLIQVNRSSNYIDEIKEKDIINKTLNNAGLVKWLLGIVTSITITIIIKSWK